MEDTVKIILDDQEYVLIYNEQTELYELSLTAPTVTGLHVIDVIYSSGDETAIDDVDLVVLKKEEPVYLYEETIAYFLDKKTFEILDAVQLNIQEINRDLETNGNSIFISFKELSIEEGDFIYLKKNDKMSFLGIVQNQEQTQNSNSYTITCKDVLSLFDVDMFVENEDVISSIGIEDFIKETIENEFINNTDTFVNRSFFSVEALTHTKKNISVGSIVTVSNNIYNLLTFINNAIQKYDLDFDFILNGSTLKLQISTRTEDKMLIDTTTSDITNYSEVFSLSYTAKVEVYINATKSKYYRYLLNDRTTTTDKTNPNRVYGKTEKITVEDAADAEQASLDVFKGNSYKHNITFEILKTSKLYDISKIKLGTPVLIKTKNNIVQNTYISKIVDANQNYLTISCGNIRVDYIDKFLQERRN
ncbi:MAG TPA: hypothetical protein IAB45_03575 [Candidatus Onthousia faecavium]|nr:hypothetical protein [Candidatus Onthousia faecavium]